ncbi:MAG: hypothetical protein ACRC46_03415, partial [Thermoguttaceae bacterium]
MTSLNLSMGGVGFMAFPEEASVRVQNYSHNQGQAEAILDYVLVDTQVANLGFDHNHRQNTKFGNGVKYIKVSDVRIKPQTPVKVKIELLQYGPLLFEEPKTIVFDSKNAVADESYRFSIPVDATSLPTGNYNWQARLTRYYENGASDSAMIMGRQGIFNNLVSPVSRGWSIALIPKLVKDGDGILFLYRGMHKFNNENGKWVANKTYDLSDYTLLGDWDKGFTLTSKDRKTRSFDSKGRILSESDINGKTTAFEYDAEGRLWKKTTPEKYTTEFRYDDETGYLREVVNSRGQVTSFEQDDKGRVVAIIGPSLDDGASHVTRFTYHDNDLLASVTMPNGETTRYEYDHAKRLSKAIHPNGLVDSFVSSISAGIPVLDGDFGTDANPASLIPTDSIASTKSVNGKTTTTKYDIWGKPIEITDPLGRKREFVRNAQGQVLKEFEVAMDGNGNVVSIKTEYKYDQRGNRVKETLPRARGTRTWEYDSKTNAVTKYTDETGLTTVYEIDPKTGNAVKETVLAGPTEGDHVVTRYCYSQPSKNSETIPGGLLLAAIDPVGYATGNAYDLKGHLLERFQYAENGEEHFANGNGTWTINQLTPGKRYEVFATWSNSQQNTSKAIFSAYLGEKKDAEFATQISQQVPPQRHLFGSLGQQEDYQSVGQFTADSAAVQVKGTLANKATGRIASGKIRLVEIETLVSYQYDENDRLITQTDANGVKTEFVYDALGRRVKTIRADGQTSETFYDFAGRSAYTKNNLGIVAGNSFDVANRSVEEFHFNPDVVAAEFQPRRKSQNEVEWTLKNLDPDKRYEVVASWNAKGDLSTSAVFTIDCGAECHFSKPTDMTTSPGFHPIAGEGFRSLGTFGGRDGKINIALKSEQNISGVTLKILEIESLARYEYDLEGDLIASTDRFGSVTRYEHDELKRRTKTVSPTTDPDKPVAVSQTVYDEAGNPWKQVDPYGYVTENLYGMFG